VFALLKKKNNKGMFIAYIKKIKKALIGLDEEEMQARQIEECVKMNQSVRE
jgi:hypothetical protein